MIDFSGMKEVSIGGVKLRELSVGGVKIWQAGRLPAGYTEVEWIRASANVDAYIDLGISFDTKARIEASMYFLNTSNAHAFGAAENSGKLRCMISAPYGSKIYVYGSTGSAYNSSGNNSPTFTQNEPNVIEAVWEKGRLYIENRATNTSATDTTQAEYTMTNHLLLFAQNYNGTPRMDGIRQFGYFKYYDKNDALIRDMVPCIRKSDGTAGMYDLIGNTFYGNAGAGQFTAGAVV